MSAEFLYEIFICILKDGRYFLCIKKCILERKRSISRRTLNKCANFYHRNEMFFFFLMIFCRKNWRAIILYTNFRMYLTSWLFDYSCTLTVIKISRKNARLGTWNQSTYHHMQSAFHARKFPWRPSSVYKYVEKKPWRVSIPAVSVYIVQNIRFKYRLEDV